MWLPGAPTQIRKWGDNYGERSEPTKFFARGGHNPSRNSKTNNAGIKVEESIPHRPVSAPMVVVQLQSMNLNEIIAYRLRRPSNFPLLAPIEG
jgi:hypothetical protein